jgi:hypothetical protein
MSKQTTSRRREADCYLLCDTLSKLHLQPNSDCTWDVLCSRVVVDTDDEVVNKA